jgi:transcriptional regulator with XRE-family HTH domain
VKKYRTIAANEVFARLPAERRKKIEHRASELIAEEYALRELREAKKLTQEDVAHRLGGRQVYVSRLEKRSDMKLSTLRDYIGALGGKLEVVASFPKGRRVKLSDLGKPKTAKRPGVRAPKNRRNERPRKSSGAVKPDKYSGSV